MLHTSVGKYGYGIHAAVNDSTAMSQWGASQSTNQLDFYMDSSVRGDGNSSNYARISGFAGINSKENTYAKKGRLIRSDRLILRSIVNWITIYETVSNHSERYNVYINESLPTILLDTSDIKYRGDGIFSRNTYINNEDEIQTNYHADKFTKTSALLSKYLNANVTAEVTPTQIKEFVGRNYSTSFRVISDSDRYSEFIFNSKDGFVRGSYIGAFKLDQKLLKQHEFYIPNLNKADELECCLNSGYPIPNAV